MYYSVKTLVETWKWSLKVLKGNLWNARTFFL